MNEALDPLVDNSMTEFRVIGPPGCGKTTWLGRQVERAAERGRSVLVGSLTKAAAAEIGSRQYPIPQENLGTLHSHCHRVLGRPELAQVKAHLEKWNAEHPLYRMTPVDQDSSDVSLAREPSGRTRGDELLSQYDILRATMTTHRMSPVLKAFVKRWERWKSVNGLYDFTDLILKCWEAVDEAPGAPDVIFMDEAQDLSRLEIQLVRKWGRQGGRLVLVGDPDQCLYQWRGTDPTAFTSPVLPDTQYRVLSQSYRVPVLVHSRAVGWIRRLPHRVVVDYLPREEAGSVITLSANWTEPARLINDVVERLSQGQKAMIIASCRYMLVPVIKELRKRGIPYHNPYRRSEKQWNPLSFGSSDSLVADAIASFLQLKDRGFWTLADVQKWASVLRDDSFVGRVNFTQIDHPSGHTSTGIRRDSIDHGLPDDAFATALQGSLDWFSHELKPGLRRAGAYPLAIAIKGGREQLLAPPGLVIGTIHSTKGGEADVVYLVPDLSRAGLKQWSGGHQKRGEVVRTFYVGMTRARDTLVLCAPADMRAPRL